MQSHIRKVYACLAVTCHLHFWQYDRDFLRATVVTRGWNGYRSKSQHRKSTLEKKILPPFQQGFEPATFQSRVRRSNHWSIPAPPRKPVLGVCVQIRPLHSPAPFPLLSGGITSGGRQQGLWAGLKQRPGLGSIPLRLSFFMKKVVVCGHSLVTLSLTINETIKWLSSLPILMQESFWWWQWAISVYSPSSPPHLPVLIALWLLWKLSTMFTKGLH